MQRETNTQVSLYIYILKHSKKCLSLITSSSCQCIIMQKSNTLNEEGRNKTSEADRMSKPCNNSPNLTSFQEWFFLLSIEGKWNCLPASQPTKTKNLMQFSIFFFLLLNVAALIDRDVCAEENIKKFSFKKGSKKLQQWINAIKVGSRMCRTKGRKKSKDDDKKIALKMIVPSLFLFVTTSYQANFFFMCRELCISEKRLKHYLCLFNKQHRSEIIKGEGSNTHLLLFFILPLSLFSSSSIKPFNVLFQ